MGRVRAMHLLKISQIKKKDAAKAHLPRVLAFISVRVHQTAIHRLVAEGGRALRLAHRPVDAGAHD